MAAEDNIISAWNANNNFDDAFGINNGTGVCLTFDEVNQKLGSAAFESDGLNDYMSTPLKSKWGFSVNGALGSWVKTTSGVGSAIFSLGADNLSNEFLLYMLPTGEAAIFNHKALGIFTYMPSTVTINDGNYHRIVGVIDGSKDDLHIYVDGVNRDGVLVTSGSPTDIVDTENRRVILAERSNLASETYVGLLDANTLWGSTPTAADILEDWKGGVGQEYSLSIVAGGQIINGGMAGAQLINGGIINV